MRTSTLIRWVNQMEEFGPEFIEGSKEWHDHPLQRDWVGYRASAFGAKGRIIYRVVGFKVTVVVYRVTVEHNYRR